MEEFFVDIVPILFDLFLVAFLVFMNGFFVASEFACVKIRPSRLEMLIQEGNRQARYAKELTDHLDTSLSVTQLGITLASLGLGWIGEPAMAGLILPVTELAVLQVQAEKRVLPVAVWDRFVRATASLQFSRLVQSAVAAVLQLISRVQAAVELVFRKNLSRCLLRFLPELITENVS